MGSSYIKQAFISMGLRKWFQGRAIITESIIRNLIFHVSRFSKIHDSRIEQDSKREVKEISGETGAAWNGSGYTCKLDTVKLSFKGTISILGYP